jgi:hypothetical protein
VRQLLLSFASPDRTPAEIVTLAIRQRADTCAEATQRAQELFLEHKDTFYDIAALLDDSGVQSHVCRLEADAEELVTAAIPVRELRDALVTVQTETEAAMAYEAQIAALRTHMAVAAPAVRRCQSLQRSLTALPLRPVSSPADYCLFATLAAEFATAAVAGLGALEAMAETVPDLNTAPAAAASRQELLGFLKSATGFLTPPLSFFNRIPALLEAPRGASQLDRAVAAVLTAAAPLASATAVLEAWAKATAVPVPSGTPSGSQLLILTATHARRISVLLSAFGTARPTFDAAGIATQPHFDRVVHAIDVHAEKTIAALSNAIIQRPSFFSALLAASLDAPLFAEALLRHAAAPLTAAAAALKTLTSVSPAISSQPCPFCATFPKLPPFLSRCSLCADRTLQAGARTLLASIEDLSRPFLSPFTHGIDLDSLSALHGCDQLLRDLQEVSSTAATAFLTNHRLSSDYCGVVGLAGSLSAAPPRSSPCPFFTAIFRGVCDSLATAYPGCVASLPASITSSTPPAGLVSSLVETARTNLAAALTMADPPQDLVRFAATLSQLIATVCPTGLPDCLVASACSQLESLAASLFASFALIAPLTLRGAASVASLLQPIRQLVAQCPETPSFVLLSASILQVCRLLEAVYAPDEAVSLPCSAEEPVAAAVHALLIAAPDLPPPEAIAGCELDEYVAFLETAPNSDAIAVHVARRALANISVSPSPVANSLSRLLN